MMGHMMRRKPAPAPVVKPEKTPAPEAPPSQTTASPAKKESLLPAAPGGPGFSLGVRRF